ncbi:MAG: hypothetical protein WBA29_12950, partial [Xanthobacteraceae bacterium]
MSRLRAAGRDWNDLTFRMLLSIEAPNRSALRIRDAFGGSMTDEAGGTGRRILCVFPRYTSSFGTFEYSYPLTDGVQAFMPPQGLLLIA